MQISLSIIKRLGLPLSAAVFLAASTMQTAPPAAAATDPFPSPTTACSSLTLTNLQAVIDAFNTVINSPATQDINSVPSPSVWPGASPVSPRTSTTIS